MKRRNFGGIAAVDLYDLAVVITARLKVLI